MGVNLEPFSQLASSGTDYRASTATNSVWTPATLRNGTRTSCGQQLQRVSLVQWKQISERARAEAAPMIIVGVLADSPALTEWTPRNFAERFIGHRVSVVIDLPDHGVPYLNDHSAHSASMPFEEFIGRMEKGERCYLGQSPLDDHSGLRQEIDFSSLVVPPVYGANLWVGNDTRSGLHFDSADNFLVQIYGEKQAFLFDPRHGGALSPFPDTPSKSQIDLANSPSGRTSECLRNVPHWQGKIFPGDALYIPRGWWHYLSSPGTSISVNSWNGPRLSFTNHLNAYLLAGPATWMRTIRDFVWCGVLGHQYHQRMFSPIPMGVEWYRRITRGVQ
jgi:lysine-specific demethylase 8